MKHISAEQALNSIDAEKQVLVCFATIKDLLLVQSTLERIDRSRQTSIFRIEPTEENAMLWQRSKHPSFSLFRNGNEIWTVVGCEELQNKLEQNEL